MPSIKKQDPRIEHLKRRGTASGLLSLGGLTFAWLCLQFDRSTGSPAIWGIYAMAGGFAGYVTYKIRYLTCVVVQRRRSPRRRLTSIVYSGGIR
jgi:hypothetical protein